MKNKKDIIIFTILGIVFITGIILIYISNNLDNNNNNELVTDNVKFFISLIGEDEMTVYKDDTFIDPGYNASNNLGENLNSEVIVSGEVNTSIIGEYNINYILGDTTKIRKVLVIERPVDHTYIHLTGERIIYLNKGEKYTEPGYTVFDSYNSGLSNNDVKVTNNVDTNKAGVYKIVYEVTNSRGITTSEVRTVIVMDSDISLSLDNTNYTNKEVAINIYVNDIYFDYMILPNETKIDTPSYSYQVSNNGTYKFRIYNKVGKEKEASISVQNIDKSAPTGSCSGTYGSGASTVNITANDNVGIARYVIDGTTYTSSSIKLNKEVSKVNITIYDKAGNSKDISCNLTDNNPITTTTGVPLGTNPGFTVTYDYAIYVPENATTNMPLYIILPPNDSDYTYKTQQNFIKNWPYGKFPIFVLIPRNPKNYSAIRAKADEMIDKYRIDKSHIYATGFSSSGTYVYYLVGRNQDLFAAMVVFSSGMECNYDIIKNNMNYFKTLPTKGFGEIPGRYDQNGHKCGGWTTWSPVSAMTRLFDCLGRSEDFTPVGKICHDKIHEYTFHQDNDNSGQSDLLEWMLKQSKK